jgi:hypothetical protein
MSDCICGGDHDEVTREQIIAAEMRKPLQAREDDPFPELLGGRTVDCSTRWHKGGVLLSDHAAAACGTPEELNRWEARMEAELLRHVKAGLRPPGLAAPSWVQELPSAPEEAQKPVGRPRKARKKETAKRALSAEQRIERAAHAARIRRKKATKRASPLPV